MINRVCDGKTINIENSLLLASGLNYKKRTEVRGILDAISLEFEKYAAKKLPSLHLEEIAPEKRAELLHQFIWQDRSQRYDYTFIPFEESIKREFRREEDIGNCVNLTIIYSMLAERAWISTTTVKRENHIWTRTRDSEGKIYDIDNTVNSGFMNHPHPEIGIEKPNVYLIGVYMSWLGDILTDSGELDRAKKLLDGAIRICPDYHPAYGARAVLKYEMGDKKGYREDGDKSLEMLETESNYFRFLEQRQK
jgi:tetratricopeptide (TPR) repeat protein